MLFSQNSNHFNLFPINFRKRIVKKELSVKGREKEYSKTILIDEFI